MTFRPGLQGKEGRRFRPARVVLLACIAGLAFCAAADIEAPNAGEAPKDVEAPNGVEAAARGDFSRGVIIRFEGVIAPRVEQYLYRKVAAARKEGADLLILEIDSPGGYLHTSKSVARWLENLDWAHTVAYIPSQALSGAAIVALGCDEIIMHSAATIGDAGPIFQDENFQFRHAPEKVRSDLVRTVRDLAEARGRPPALAEAMVDMDLVVFHVTNRETGEETFLSDAEIEADPAGDRWEKLNPVLESHEGAFLEVNGERAVELGLADATVARESELKDRFGLPDELIRFEPGGVDTAVYILNLPFITGLLFVVGLVALFVEFTAPGIGIGGLISILCFALFFWSRFLGGTAELLEVVLFVVGLIFVMIELFVLPGFGVAGLTGILLVFAGLILACQDFVVPSTQSQWIITRNTLLAVFGSGVAVLAAGVSCTWYFGSIPLLGRLVLKAPDPEDTKPDTSPERRFGISVNDRGTADSPLRPAGKAQFGDHYVDVVTEGTFVDSGRPVRIVRISGNRIVVREVEEEA